MFEECLHLGYVQERLRNQGPAFAIGASVFLRLAVHAYQGPAAIAGIVPYGIVVSLFYWRRKSLWAPIVAHAIADVIGLIEITP